MIMVDAKPESVREAYVRITLQLFLMLGFHVGLGAQTERQPISYIDVLGLLRLESPQQVLHDIGRNSCADFKLSASQRDSLTHVVTKLDPDNFPSLAQLFRFIDETPCPHVKSASNPIMAEKPYWLFSVASYEDVGFGVYGGGVERRLGHVFGWEIVSGLRIAWGNYIADSDSLRVDVSHTRMAVDARLRRWIVPSKSDFGAFSQFGLFLQTEGFSSSLGESRRLGFGMGAGLGMATALNSELMIGVDGEAQIYWRGGLRYGFSDYPYQAVPLRIVLIWFPS
jgi:hypothetical protein